MNELTKKEINLLKTLHVSAKAKEEIEKIWLSREYKYQHEYKNLLLFLMPIFIIIFLATLGNPELDDIKNICAGAAWVIYFAIPIILVFRVCYRTLESNDRTVLLGHTSLYLWRRPSLIKRIYMIAVSLLFVIIIAKAGMVITSTCLALTFIFIAFCIKLIRKKVQIVLDEIDQNNVVPECIPEPVTTGL